MKQSEHLVFQTKNFTLERHPKPFVSREEGGHLRIWPKDKSITDRSKLSSELAGEYMLLSMIAGEAMEIAMNKVGVNVIKVNYHDMGNWPFKRGETPILHMHIFGRAKDAVKQKFPEAVYLPDRSSGFYDDFDPLSSEDVVQIKNEIDILLGQEKFALLK